MTSHELERRLSTIEARIVDELPYDARKRVTADDQLQLVLTYLGGWLADVLDMIPRCEPASRDRERSQQFRENVIALIGHYRGGRGQSPIHDVLGPYFLDHDHDDGWGQLMNAVEQSRR